MICFIFVGCVGLPYYFVCDPIQIKARELRMMDRDTSEVKRLLGKRKYKHVAINKQEALMLLRSYQSHPCAWGEIIEEIQDNTSSLPLSTQQLYKNSTMKQLRDRLSNKLSKLLKEEEIEDDEIMSEVKKIKAMQNKNAVALKSNAATVETPGPSGNQSNKRHMIAVKLSDDEEVPKKKKDTGTETINKQEKKNQSLSAIMLKNQKEYNKFITKKIPKLLKVFGVSDSDTESD